MHRFGRTLDPADVLEQATGSRLDPAPLLDHLEAKLDALYGLSASR